MTMVALGRADRRYTTAAEPISIIREDKSPAITPGQTLTDQRSSEARGCMGSPNVRSVYITQMTRPGGSGGGGGGGGGVCVHSFENCKSVVLAVKRLAGDNIQPLFASGATGADGGSGAGGGGGSGGGGGGGGDGAASSAASLEYKIVFEMLGVLPLPLLQSLLHVAYAEHADRDFAGTRDEQRAVGTRDEDGGGEKCEIKVHDDGRRKEEEEEQEEEEAVVAAGEVEKEEEEVVVVVVEEEEVAEEEEERGRTTEERGTNIGTSTAQSTWDSSELDRSLNLIEQYFLTAAPAFFAVKQNLKKKKKRKLPRGQ
ncbi:hypothetical protein EAI_06413 [Harpegnathos saltator]|uniref:Uncharacterized protein n=1 Tax=Harpegnathos saltator TaxID=610380 RepID=E2BLZ9_HARSA|nr:hypothetical protein EAI_06413 [Harpegnathos saltator]